MMMVHCKGATLGVFAVASLAASCDNLPPPTSGASDPASGSPEVLEVALENEHGYPEAPLLTVHEEMRMGAVSGITQQEFYAISALVQDANGDLYVADNDGTRVQAFTRDGKHLWTFGNSGQGPGEFEFIGEAFLHADTLVLIDTALRRMTRVSRAGELLRVNSFAGPDQLQPVAIVAGLTIVRIARNSAFRGIGTIRADTTAYFAVPSESMRNSNVRTFRPDRAGKTVGRHLGRYNYQVTEQTVRPILWAPLGDAAVDASGTTYVHNGDYAIEAFDTTGQLVRRLVRAHSVVPVTPELVEAHRVWLDQTFDTASADSNSRALALSQRRRTEIPTGEFVPALRRILVAPTGTIWVERPDLSPDLAQSASSTLARVPTRWDIIDYDGHLGGTVELPVRFNPKVVTDSTVLGTQLDELRVEYVVRFRVGASASPD